MNHLLLIGIDEYPKFPPPGDNLTTCVKDVTDLKYVLLEKYYFDPENVQELINDTATNLNIQNALESYVSKLDINSNLVVYFSGHGGLRKSTNKGYWVPYNAKEDDHSEWLPNETILEIIREIKAKHIFIIADCCFSTSLLISNPSKSGINITLDNYASRWILTSGRKETYCGSTGENSFFGEALITLLGNAESDVRVGTIIEYIKEKFKSNILQQPQGYALMDKNHDCGEYILKIRDAKKLFASEIKGYKLFKKVIDIYAKSKNVEEIESYEDKTNKIGFTLLRENDKIKKEVSHYLYLYNEINQSRTFSYINDKYKKLMNHNLLIFIPREKDQVFHERRLANIQKLFSPRNTFYIDEFINELSSEVMRRDEGEKYLNINNFVRPEFIVANNSLKVDVEKWLGTINSPILVIKGTAGIGKTTYAKYISDYYQKNNGKDRNVLFIDSNEIQEELSYLQKLGKRIDLYSFYKAATVGDLTSFDNELFCINLDAGNLLLIIDGLDEILSRNITFDIDYFFTSINRLNIGLGNSKIIITTRTYFWEKSNVDDDVIYTIELLPFDINRARSFFEKSFNTNEIKIKKALAISEDFKLPSLNDTHYYHPFVLDIIKEIVDSNNEILFSDNVLASNILNSENRFDYIIGRICEREIRRVQQMSIDQQINFFIHLAVKEHGKLDSDNIKESIKDSLGIYDISYNIVESFKSHPFIHYDRLNATIIFKYDFFENYFISLFISNLIDINQEYLIDVATVKLLSQRLYHGSDTIKNIVKRVNQWNEYNILKINDVIQKISDLNVEDINVMKRAISGVFNLALAFNFKFKSNDRKFNTQLLKDIFETSSNRIENLVLLNLNSLEENIRFDFSGITFYNCIIENYNQFWECNLSDKTYFVECILRNIGDAQGSINIPEENFIDCDDNSSIYRAFLTKKTNEAATIKKATVFLESFFRIFYKNGKFKKISDFLLNESQNYPKINKYGVKLEEIMEVLLLHSFLLKIEDKKHGDIKVGIKNEESVLKFISEGKQTESLLRAIHAVAEKL